MDLVTSSLLSTFQQEESLPDSIDAATLFEHFVNFCALSNEYGEEFDLEDIHSGGGNDLGIDGLAVIVNGSLVFDMQEVEDLAASNKYLEVEFVFCQAKSGSSFSGAEISNFFFGVKDFFSTSPALPRNETISARESLAKNIYKKSNLFKRGNPKACMYYVTAGKWQDDDKLVARIENERESLMELNIFSEVIFKPVGARELQRMHSKATNRLSRTIEFVSKVTLPGLPGVKESYLGLLPVGQYINLITDESGNMVRGIFYDNVRDFQGENPVNHEIEETLNSPDQELFVLMNNGVTVVADAITKTGDIFTIEDFQIVNGCQTSHVLYNNFEKIEGGIQIPIKLIVSQDGEVKNKIIKATNRQTPVKTEELTALTDFQKSIEDYFDASSGDCRLYYERRSQQYRSAGVEKIRVITISNQIRSFASMFLGLSHQASRYYGTLLKSIESKIFVPGHPLVAYYVSALAFYRFESLVRKKLIDSRYRPFKYHLLAVIRAQVAGVDLPNMSSNKFERYCDKIVAALRAESKCVQVFREACDVLDKVLASDYHRDRAKDATLLSEILQEVNREETKA